MTTREAPRHPTALSKRQAFGLLPFIVSRVPSSHTTSCSKSDRTELTLSVSVTSLYATSIGTALSPCRNADLGAALPTGPSVDTILLATPSSATFSSP